LSIIEPRQDVEADDSVLVFWAKDFLVDGQGAFAEGLGLLVTCLLNVEHRQAVKN
jgi:hypothetical protein